MEDQKVVILFQWTPCLTSYNSIYQKEWFPLKGMHPLPLTSYFFHRDSNVNQTIIWLRPKQRQISKMFYNFTYFFQILGSNTCFPKIPKSTHTANLYSEFSCKSRFAKFDFTITSYLWKSNLTFCFWDRTTVSFGNWK